MSVVGLGFLVGLKVIASLSDLVYLTNTVERRQNKKAASVEAALVHT